MQKVQISPDFNKSANVLTVLTATSSCTQDRNYGGTLHEGKL